MNQGMYYKKQVTEAMTHQGLSTLCSELGRPECEENEDYLSEITEDLRFVRCTHACVHTFRLAISLEEANFIEWGLSV